MVRLVARQQAGALLPERPVTGFARLATRFARPATGFANDLLLLLPAVGPGLVEPSHPRG